MRPANALRGASVLALIAYGTSALGWLPGVLAYAPRTGAWGWGAAAGEPVILWYGYLLHALAGGALGFVAGGALRRPIRGSLPTWVAIAVVLALAFHERGWFGR